MDSAERAAGRSEDRTAGLRLGVLAVGNAQLSLDLAPRVEALGFGRFWVSEHHSEGAISAPTILVPLIAGTTDTIRVGTAGIMLRFQSALAVAESFRLLQEMFPGRIDLGIARSQAATLPQTMALYDGRSGNYSEEDHAEKVAEVQRIVAGRLLPGHPLADEWIDPPLTPAGPPPIWVMSTSVNGARLAAKLGVHCSFHDYHRPADGPEAMRRYAEEFEPSPELARPSWNVCVAGLCVAKEEEVLETSIRLLYPSYGEGRHLIFGTVDHWRRELAAVMRAYRTDEVIVQSMWGTYNLEEQVASFERIAHAARTL